MYVKKNVVACQWIEGDSVTLLGDWSLKMIYNSKRKAAVFFYLSLCKQLV